MISIQRQTDYAARVILHLALQPSGSRVTAHQIGEQRVIPGSFVRRIVTRLAASGLITTQRGMDGGIMLSRSPAEISLLDVVDAMEGPIILNVCTEDPTACPLMPQCSVHRAWVGLRRELAESLRNVTFDKLARDAGRGTDDFRHRSDV